MQGKYPGAKSKYLAKKAERDRLLDQAGVDDAVQRREAIVRKNENFLHIYYGDGLGRGNWDGHGHVVINLLSGKVAYRRAPEPAPAPEPEMELAPNVNTA